MSRKEPESGHHRVLMKGSKAFHYFLKHSNDWMALQYYLKLFFLRMWLNANTIRYRSLSLSLCVCHIFKMQLRQCLVISQNHYFLILLHIWLEGISFKFLIRYLSNRSFNFEYLFLYSGLNLNFYYKFIEFMIHHFIGTETCLVFKIEEQ